MKNAALMELANLKMAVVPVDLNTAANPGARIPLTGGQRVSWLILMGASTGAVVNATLQQHDAASAGNSKALSVSNAYYHKVSTATKFTKVVPGSAAAAFDVSTIFAALGGIAVFEVLAEDLDRDNNYAYASLSLDDSTAAKVGAVVAFIGNNRTLPAYSQDV